MVAEFFADQPADAVEFGDVVVVGGGCYGTFYARQLERAAARGRARFRRMLLVDRDPACRASRELGPLGGRSIVVAEWGAFFDEYLGAAAPSTDPPDIVVPSPLMPHLMYEWLVRRAAARWPGRPVERRPVDPELGTPYDILAPDGTRYVSFADWLCPVHCIEPGVCPRITAPRTWEMLEAVEGLAARLGAPGTARPAIAFRCRHRVFGVGAFDVAEVLAADRAVAEAGRPGHPVDLLVGTISSCHGALSLLHLGGEGEASEARRELSLGSDEPRNIRSEHVDT
jgi:hypothetical protein